MRLAGLLALSAGGFGAASAASVALPTAPSAPRPCTFWNAMTALLSAPPALPSIAPP